MPIIGKKHDFFFVFLVGLTFQSYSSAEPSTLNVTPVLDMEAALTPVSKATLVEPATPFFHSMF